MLTTGEMIDKLKVGEIAENERGYKVVVNELGGIGCIENPMNSSNLNGIFVSSAWEILPNYVSFEEAMNALKDGKIIRCRLGDNEFEYQMTNGRVNNYKSKPSDKEPVHWYHIWDQITDGKWSIGDNA